MFEVTKYVTIKTFTENVQKAALLTLRKTFSITDFFSKCDQIRRKLRTFTEEICDEKFRFLRNVTKMMLNASFPAALQRQYLMYVYDT